jgi:hypothetical protein
VLIVACIRTVVLDRLDNLNLDRIRLPLGASQNDPHTQILVSKDIKQKKRVIVLFGERHQDLGIFSYRVLGNENLNQGSAIDLVTAIEHVSGVDGMSRGIVIANPGQLLWYRGGGRAVTYSEWMSLSRPSAVHDALEMDSSKNFIPSNRDYQEHVQYIFENVMRELVREHVKFELIGLESTGHAMIEYLASHCKSKTKKEKATANSSQGMNGLVPSKASAWELHSTTRKSSSPREATPRTLQTSSASAAVHTSCRALVLKHS